MAERRDVERVARGIIEDASREFSGIVLRLDFETPRDDHEDACPVSYTHLTLPTKTIV